MPFWNLRPVAVGDYDFWTLGAGATKPAAVDPGDYPGTHDGDTSYIRIAAAPGSNRQQSFKFGSRPKMAALIAVRYKVRVRHETIGAGVETIYVYARMNGVDGTAVSVTPGTGYTDYEGTVARPGGGVWTIADAENPDLQSVFSVPTDNADPARDTTGWFELEYVPADPGEGREIGTALLRVIRRPVRYSSLGVGPSIFDVELMDDVSFSHYAHPLTRILGIQDHDGFWRPGAEGYQRVLTQHRMIETDLNTLKSKIDLRDRRRELVTFFDSASSRRTAASIEDGVAILTTGGARVYARASDSWARDPGSGLVTRFLPNQRPIGAGGYGPESFSSQLLTRTSFVSGVTGLTHSGSGTGTAESNPPEPLFDSSVSSQCLLLTAGNPHASDGVETWPVSATVPSTANLKFSIDHRDDSGAGLDYQLQRTSDGRYWNDAITAWTIGTVWNALPVRTTRARDKNNLRILLSAGDSVTLRLRQASGGTASRLNRVYHVQLEDNGIGFMTSWIVADAFNRARELQTYTIQNNSGKRSFNNAQGTFLCRFLPSWDANDMNVTADFPSIFELKFDANNSWLLFYDGATGSTMRFVARVGGTDYGSFLSFAPVAGTEYIIGCRWLGSVPAFGLVARSVNVFAGVPGSVVRGSEGFRVGDPSEADSLLYVGTSPTAAAANGVMNNILFTQEILSDDEIKAGRW